MNSFGFNQIDMKEDLAGMFKQFFNDNNYKRQMYITKSNSHTVEYNGSSLFAATGVMTDRYFGDWWITSDISPYRKHMLNEFYNWIKTKDNITKFTYPEISVLPSKTIWEAKYIDKHYSKIGMSVNPCKQFRNYVYLGSGIWALYERNPDGEYLLGGLELSDNSLRSGLGKWAAQLTN